MKFNKVIIFQFFGDGNYSDSNECVIKMQDTSKTTVFVMDEDKNVWAYEKEWKSKQKNKCERMWSEKSITKSGEAINPRIHLC